jgi:CRP-like cAMP-binding protein
MSLCPTIQSNSPEILTIALCSFLYSSAEIRPIGSKSKNLRNSRKIGSFNARAFLDTASVARKVTEYRRNESIYSQGDAAETVMCVQKGGVKLSVVNGSGKEAVVAMFGRTDFFGEGRMAGQTLRMGTTTAVTPTTLLVIRKEELGRRGFDRSTLQLQRKAFGAHALTSGALRETRTTRSHPAEDFPGDPGKHGRDDAFPCEFLHEQIPKTWVRRIQRRTDQCFAPQCCPARLTHELRRKPRFTLLVCL